ncbi:hypothetical protein TSOC_003859 [Tetrabaena socialis]|uniref:Uncharacterized protein n=1 Tax=Tetrabaena socialis TaxID=47790 RepID=A0A2J8AAI5_9CHLO|nr:hypothetical protein TSOC_003859 [Tetrabaena socialis]|eukprot:PNH09522.1 hypothetical protein TSOC_003859 [Tetrabaena socialis]
MSLNGAGLIAYVQSLPYAKGSKTRVSPPDSMEANVARVAASAASLMIRRKDSLERVVSFGAMMREWSARAPRGDMLRRMTMGGAASQESAAAPPPPAFMDAFCAVQLTPRNSTSKDSMMLLSPKASLTVALPSMPTPPANSMSYSMSPMASGLLSPAMSLGEPLASSKSKGAPEAFTLCHPVA